MLFVQHLIGHRIVNGFYVQVNLFRKMFHSLLFWSIFYALADSP